MPPLGTTDRPMTLRRWFASTPRRSFILYPILIVLWEAALRQGWPAFNPWGAVLLVWGYLQYRLSGKYRTDHGGGGPGLDKPPQRIVDSGVYSLIRNPMYLGHLVFFAGLAVTFNSLAGLLLLAFHIWWFHRRVLEDERKMLALFGEAFENYMRRVRRWGIV